MKWIKWKWLIKGRIERWWLYNYNYIDQNKREMDTVVAIIRLD